MKIINNKYKVIKKIGSGTSGQVFLVLDGEEKEIALKLLNKNFKAERIRRLKKEFNIMKSLNHPNIAAVYDFDYDKILGNYYFTLEYISGGNINSFNKSKDSLDILLECFYQLLLGLNYLHFNNNIHYDLSDNNVLISLDKSNPLNFTVKITDFGLSSKFDSSNSGDIVGTLDFISPEIYNREVIDYRTDLFSAGMILLNYLNNYKSDFSYLSLEKFSKMDKDFDELLLKKRIFKLKDGRLKRYLLKLLDIDPELRIASAKDAIVFLNKTFERNFEIPKLVPLDLNNLNTDKVSFDKDISDQLIKIFNTSKLGNGKYIVLKGDNGSGKGRLINEFKIYNQFIGNGFTDFKIGELIDKNTFVDIDQLRFFLKKFLYSLEYDIQMELKESYISDLLVLLDDKNFYNKEKYDYFMSRFVSLFDNLTQKGNRYIIAFENIERIDEKLYNFIIFFLENLYDKLNHFFLFSVDPNKISRLNFNKINRIISKDNKKNVVITLRELKVEQIEFLFKMYFNGIKNIPNYVYNTIRKFSGNHLSKVKYIFKLLFNKEVIVKTEKGFSLTSLDMFKKVIDNYITEELIDNKENLCLNKMNIMYYLALSSVGLSLKQLSSLTSIAEEQLNFIILNIKTKFFIEEKSIQTIRSETLSVYYLNSELTKNIFLSVIPDKEIPILHCKISDVIDVLQEDINKIKLEEYTNDTILSEDIIAKYIHSYLGKNRKFLKRSRDIDSFKLLILANKNFNEYIKLNDAIIGSELDTVKNKRKMLLCYENIILIYEQQLEIKVDKYINLFNNYLNLTISEDKAATDEFSFMAYIVKFIGISYSKDIDIIKFKEFFDDTELVMKKVIVFFNDKYRNLNEMKILVNTTINFFEIIFKNLEDYKVLFIRFLLFLKNDNRFKLEYYYTRLLNIIFLINREGLNNIINQKHLQKFEQKIENNFNLIKEKNNSFFTARSYQLISKYYSKKSVTKENLIFFREASKYLEDKKQSRYKYEIIFNYSKFLEKDFLFTNALKAITSILNEELNSNFLTEIVKLMYKRVFLKKYLEFPISEIEDELHNIIEYKKDSRFDIWVAYEELVYLQYEKGDFTEMSRLLDRYLYLMNSREKDLRSIDCYLKYNLNFFKITEVVDNFSNFLGKLGISDDEFLDIIIDYKERNRLDFFINNNSNFFKNTQTSTNNEVQMNNSLEQSNNLLQIKTIRFDNIKNNLLLTNEFIIDFINYFIYEEETKEVDRGNNGVDLKSNQKKNEEIYLNKIRYSDKESAIYKRSKIVYNLLKGKDYNLSLSYLYKDIKKLYKKKYINTSHKFATVIAKFVFYKKKDNKMFLKFAELSLKIVSEIFSNSKAEYRFALEKNEDIILLNDIVKYIKKKSEARS